MTNDTAPSTKTHSNVGIAKSRTPKMRLTNYTKIGTSDKKRSHQMDQQLYLVEKTVSSRMAHNQGHGDRRYWRIMKNGMCIGCDHNVMKEQFKDHGFGKFTNNPAPFCTFYGIHLEWMDRELIHPGDEICDKYCSEGQT